MSTPSDRHAKICFVVAPSGQTGGGMGRVKDYILQSGGDRHGRIRFVALDTRGPGSAVASVPRLLSAVGRIWGAALLGRLALVHVNLGDRGSAARKGLVVILARLAGVPVVLHLHAAELHTDYARAPSAMRWLLRQPFHAATCCVVLGRQTRDWLTGTLGVQADRIEILRNGVPVVPLPRTVVQEDQARRILFLGNLLERKGISDLLHALALLPADGPSWQATIAGGGDIEKYRALAASLGLAGRTNFAGWVDQATARSLLANSEMLVLPSYDEGLPLVILEALGMGTPVVCTPVGVIPEVLDDGRTAVFAQPGDRDGLSRKLALLLGDDALRQALSRDGLALFARQFTLDAFINELFAIYRRHCNVEIERAVAAPHAIPAAA